jgi:hypothetical protein
MAINWLSGSEIESDKEDQRISVVNQEELKRFVYYKLEYLYLDESDM